MTKKVYMVPIRHDLTYVAAIVAGSPDEARTIAEADHHFDPSTLQESCVFFDPDSGLVHPTRTECRTTISRATEASPELVEQLQIDLSDYQEPASHEPPTNFVAPEREADKDHTAAAASEQNAQPEGTTPDPATNPPKATPESELPPTAVEPAKPGVTMAPMTVGAPKTSAS